MGEKTEHAPLSDDALDYIILICHLELARRDKCEIDFGITTSAMGEYHHKLTPTEIETTNNISGMIGGRA